MNQEKLLNYLSKNPDKLEVLKTRNTLKSQKRINHKTWKKFLCTTKNWRFVDGNHG